MVGWEVLWGERGERGYISLQVNSVDMNEDLDGRWWVACLLRTSSQGQWMAQSDSILSAQTWLLDGNAARRCIRRSGAVWSEITQGVCV